MSARRVLGALAGILLLATPVVSGRPAPAEPVDALVHALARCRAALTRAQRRGIAEVIDRESHRWGYDPLFVQAMVEVESTCSPTARSRRGAVGLLQVKPSTARALAREAGIPWDGAETLTSPIVNVPLAVRYLAGLEERFHDPYLAVAAYNLGPTRVARMSRGRARGAFYVRRVLARYEDLVAAHLARVS